MEYDARQDEYLKEKQPYFYAKKVFLKGYKPQGILRLLHLAYFFFLSIFSDAFKLI